MKRPIKVFEAIPKPLIKAIHLQGKQHGFSENDVYRLVEDLTGISSITALSKQEALFLIGTMTGQTVRAVLESISLRGLQRPCKGPGGSKLPC